MRTRRRLSSDKLHATDSTQHSPSAISAISWRMSALLGAAAVVAFLLAVALFSGAIRFSGRCAVPPARVHATLTGLVQRGLSRIELPAAPSSVHRQHAGSGMPYAAIGTINTSLHALRFGAVEITACYPDGRTFFDQIPPRVIVRLGAVNATASLRYQGYAAFGELVLELDLVHPAEGKVTTCGGEFEAVARTGTGTVQTATGTVQRNEAAVSSDVAQAICHGSSSESGIGARPKTSLGLMGALNEGVRVALPELRADAKAAADGTLLRLLTIVAVLLVVVWACIVGRPRTCAVALVRSVYAWVHQSDLRFQL